MNKITAELFSAEVEVVDGFGVGLDAIMTNRTTVQATFTSLSESLTPFRYRVEGTASQMFISDEPTVDFKYTKYGLVGTTFTVFFRDEAGETVWDSYTIHYWVYSYQDPKLIPAVTGASDIVCRRCSEDGTVSTTGNSVRISAARTYTVVKGVSGSNQVNFCAIRYRWKASTDPEYGEWTELLSCDDLSTDSVDVVLDLGLGITTAYDIQVGVVDTAGGSHTVTKQIPTARTPLHLGRGGKNIGLGGFCDYSHEEAIDAFWDMWFHKGMEVLGDASFAGAVNVDGQLTLGGIGIKTVFRGETTEACWNGGQLLSEAFPNANPALLEQGRVFLAVVRSNGKQPVLCARVTDTICGSTVDCIAGSVVTLINTSGNYNPRRQDSLQFRMTPEGSSYRLNSFLLQIYDGSAYATAGEVLTPSRGIQEIAEDSVVIDALYVLL